MLFAHARMKRFGVVLAIMLFAAALGLGGNAYAHAPDAGDPGFFALKAADTPANSAQLAPKASHTAATVSKAQPAGAAPVVANALPRCASGSFSGSASPCASAACTACLATIAGENPTLVTPMAGLAPLGAPSQPLAARDPIPDLPPPRFA
jgi:hypothetical protein